MNQKIKKNGWMYAGILLTWVICLVHFNPKLFTILSATESFITKTFFIIFIFFLNLFWLYGIFHCFFLIHRIFSKNQITPEKSAYFPHVSILYTTRNDFQEKAVLSCLKQAYPNFHVYILDDSTDNANKAVIDQFHYFHPEKTTIIRRQDRRGFKAGNLNNALRHHITDHKYFAVIDADEVIPPDFLQKLIPYFSLDDRIAFVQANHGQNPHQPSKFAQDLAMGINFHWDIYQQPRNNCGFVIFYGHGAIIRRDVWEKAGGFPEIVSEDLAFSTRIRQLGYRGHFVKEVNCYEDFPETYHQFRKRHEKWVKGACEYLHCEFLPFLFSKNITWPEKFDVLFSSFSLFIPALFLIYIFVANMILPMLLAEKHTISFSLFSYRFELMSGFFMEPYFKNIWTFDFYVITLIGMFAPIFCYLGKLFSHPRQILKLLFKSAVPYISLILVSTCGIMTYLFTKKAVFSATGDKTTIESLSNAKGKSAFWNRLHANHSLIFHLEWLLGLVLVLFSIKTMNFALLTIASCLIISPLIARYGWENRVISSLVSLPLFFVLLAFGGIGTGFLGIQGFSLCFLSLHF
ncbi:MAG: glycosyltransferase family 2 protein [Nitrospirota bacterium]